MNFSKEEFSLIHSAHEKKSIWSVEKGKKDVLKPIKDKIKEHLLSHCTHCCYCRRSLRGEFKMVIDIEHILPCSIFRELAFDLDNLSLACKRCNMAIKKDRLDFLTGRLFKLGEYLKQKEHLERYINGCRSFKDIYSFHRLLQHSPNYKFIHPIIDKYSEHLTRISFEINDQSLVMYTPITPKGSYTKKFFELNEFEVKDFNNIQNIPDKENISDFLISGVI